jgi:hypothetical protein
MKLYTMSMDKSQMKGLRLRRFSSSLAVMPDLGSKFVHLVLRMIPRFSRLPHSRTLPGGSHGLDGLHDDDDRWSEFMYSHSGR